MKDVMSSVDIAAITLELVGRIVGQRVDNIYHILPKTFIIRLRPSGLRLLIEIERRIHLTQFSYLTPQTPTNFCMTLRKYLVDGTVESIEQYELERIVDLKISSSEGTYLLVAELFRRGNLILVDPDNKVRLSLRYARMRDRDVIRYEPYKPAPLSGLNPLKMDLAGLDVLRKAGDSTLLKALMGTVSLGPLYIKEILLRSDLDQEERAKNLTQTQMESIGRSLSSLRTLVLERRFDPGIVYDEQDVPIDVTPFPLKTYEGKSLKRHNTYNEAADEFFSNQATTAQLQKVEATKTEEEARLQRILKEQSEQKKLLTEAAKSNKEKGDQIYLQLHAISEIMDVIRKERERGSDLEQINQIVNEKTSGLKPSLNPTVSQEKMELDIEGRIIPIRLDKSPQQVAQEHYEAAKKATQKIKGLDESTKQIESRLKDFEAKSVIEAAQQEITTRIRERSWYEKFHWFRSSDGFLILSGKDASTNEILIRRHLETQDLVFHAEMHGAPFTIVKTEGKLVPDTTLVEAAQASVSRSKAWPLNQGSADVYWVKADQVGSKAPSGEYLGKGQFMVTGKRSYIKGVELKMAVGILNEEGDLRFFAGPPSTMKRQAEAYVELVPGRTSSAKLAKQIIEILKLESPSYARSRFNRVHLDEVARLIPAGKGTIVRRGKVFPKTL